MPLNKNHWDLWKESEKGKAAIELFENVHDERFLTKLFEKYHISADAVRAAQYVSDLLDFTTKPIFPEELPDDQVEKFFESIVDEGITMTDEEGELEISDTLELLSEIPVISTWLYLSYPDLYKPYFFQNQFYSLTRIAESFGIELPTVPLKSKKTERLKYYGRICKSFSDFQVENEMTAAEFCAFLYDFAPTDVTRNDTKNENSLPEPSAIWMIGGNKAGGDFDFLDNASNTDTSFWQGNEDTKKGDILVMYCLAPRSYIHSIWRATTDGIADPFFHWYGSIYIGQGEKINPISIDALKNDPHFKQNPLVRKNLQGVNGYPLTSEDYVQLLRLIANKGGETAHLPRVYSHSFSLNKTLQNEREVELSLIEPLLSKLGYTGNDWVRQLSVRMGRVERNRPDYTFLTDSTKDYETAYMLIESKFHIKNNREMEETFKQVWSYGQRLSATVLVIADKDYIWVYLRQVNSAFDRTKYVRKFWQELENPDDFSSIKKLIGKKK